MSWDCAANWLMDHRGPSSFYGPAPYTPDGPEDGPCSDDDHDFDAYLMDWIDRVERGDIEPMEEPSCYTIWYTRPPRHYTLTRC